MNNTNQVPPLVSIIMNCRNSEKYLPEALDSIKAQEYSHWEVIFWDNASTDKSAGIARSYGEKIRYFKNDQPVMLGKARSLAMEKAQGKYIAFLDCDDQWRPQKLQKQVAILEASPDIGFVYGNYFRMIMPRTKRLVIGLKGKQPEGDVFERFLYDYPVNLQTVILRKSVIDAAELKFDEYFQVSEEADFFLRILYLTKAAYIAEPLAVYRLHDEMSSKVLSYRYPVEAQHLIDKFKKNYDSFQSRYANGLRYFEAKLGYYYAKAEMERGNRRNARLKLKPYRFIDLKFFILYLLTFLPQLAWNIAHKYKIEGKIN
ncbi:MAG: glycosyltransferase family 2 protein [Candidatus Omnitrophota bacterium]